MICMSTRQPISMQTNDILHLNWLSYIRLLLKLGIIGKSLFGGLERDIATNKQLLELLIG